MKFDSDSDLQENRNLRKKQREFAKTDYNGRLHHNHNHNINSNSNNDNNIQPIQNQSTTYIPYNQRSSYNPKMFYGDVTKPWSSQNTAGWLASDMTNPYNPNLQHGQYVPNKKHTWRKISFALIAVLIIIIGWGAWTNHNANNQPTHPQAPRVIKKTVINRQPIQHPSATTNNSDLQNLQQHAQQLQAEMQNLKLTSQEQQELLKLYQEQNANVQSEMYTWASRLGNMQFVPNNIKRSAVVWALHHYSH